MMIGTMAEGATSAHAVPAARGALGRRRNAMAIDWEGLDGRECLGPEAGLLGMRKTTACADVVTRSIIDTYFGPNRTVANLRELVRTGHGIDPLKDFSEAAREELHAFRLL